ncbi:MAG: hypothetical protein WC346_16665 [Methanogenium sp.]
MSKEITANTKENLLEQNLRLNKIIKAQEEMIELYKEKCNNYEERIYIHQKIQRLDEDRIKSLEEGIKSYSLKTKELEGVYEEHIKYLQLTVKGLERVINIYERDRAIRRLFNSFYF